MDQQELMRLTDRQLTDIQAQAEKILLDRMNGRGIEDFARQVSELRSFMRSNYTEDMILERLKTIPEIDYLQRHISPVMFFILPYYLYQFYTDYRQRERALENIRITRDIFSSIQFLNRGLLN
jgi:hypothetical protein